MRSEIRIAVPKGRLMQRSLSAFEAAGLTVPAEDDLRSRRLVFRTGGVEWIFVKDGDVPVYVEFGAADLGIAGYDQIAEQQPDVLQPIELDFGLCRMMLIAAPDAPPFEESGERKIATKYPNVARRFLSAEGIHMEIVPLQGSVELAAVLSLAPFIVDLVETGETARVHHLSLLRTIFAVAPRVIVNRNSYLLDRRIPEIVRAVAATHNQGETGGLEAAVGEVAR